MPLPPILRRPLQRVRPAQLLSPGVRLMRRLRMPAKLLLLSCSLLLPLTVTIAWWLGDQWQARETLLAEGEGLAAGGLLVEVKAEHDRLRDLTVRIAQGEVELAAERDDQAKALLGAMAAVDARLGQSNRLELPEWRQLRQPLEALTTRSADHAAAAAYAGTGRALRETLRVLNERSLLLLDADAESYEWMLLAVGGVMPAIEAASATRSLGGALALRGEAATVEERAGALVEAARLDHAIDDIATVVGSLRRLNSQPPRHWQDAREGALTLARLVQEVPRGQNASRLRRLTAEAGTHAVHQLVLLQREAAQTLQARLDARRTATEQRMAAGSALFGAGLAALTYLLISLYMGFRDSLATLLGATQGVARGDFSHRMAVPGRDELAEIGHTVDTMAERLSALVAEIRSSAARVKMAGIQVADGSGRLMQRTDEQASSLTDTATAIGQLSSAVEHNSKAARDLDALTEELARKAGTGHEAMQRTMATMQATREAAERVFEVVSVIDDVAFQTGMLSLNAAVEAARAGDAGKGFAVVASEVRQLAQRVSESSEQIRNLITSAGDQLRESDDQLGAANGALDTLVGGVREVSARLREIANASSQQSDGLSEINARIGSLDEITRANAQMVDQSTAASQALMERASALNTAVGAMRLRQGSADEAHALVDRAFAHLQSVGREQGLKDLHKPELGFIDRDLYVFALDRAGVYIACGAKADLVGTSVETLPGIRGTPFVRNVWGAAEAGGGWVEYEIANPLTGEVTPKESFVRQLDDALLIGCGVYRNAAARQVASLQKPRAASWAAKAEHAAAAPAF